MKKLHARMGRPIDPGTRDSTVPFLQHSTVEHALEESGVRQILFFVDPKDSTIFSITVYDTEEDLNDASQDAASEFRFRSLASLRRRAPEAAPESIVPPVED